MFVDSDHAGGEDAPAHISTASRDVRAPDACRLYHFHANLLAAPPAASFDCTWENAAAKLECLPRMIFELDGSFVISGTERAGPSPAPIGKDQLTMRWQVDGHLFDFADRLHRVELHGQCPPTAFDDLLRCLDWPTQAIVFEMVREGTTLDEQAFRNWAGAAGAVDGPAC